MGDGIYKRFPVPDLMLGQHIVPSIAGTVSIRSGPVLVAADSVRIRVIDGPCKDSTNPQLCVDPIPLSMRIIQGLQDKVKDEVGKHEDVTVACWGFHAGEPGNDYVAYADILLDVKTVNPSIRRRALDIIERHFRDECNSEAVPTDPVFNYTVRSPLTSNDEAIVGPISKVFETYFGSNAGEMAFTRACEDLSTLGATQTVPYAYWNHGDTPIGTKKPFATNHSPFFAPAIQPTLKTGTDVMALAALAFLVC
ncbi:Ff.00g014640.m01.CDS01 [Fusarium sp. VM40]|nr:Ff.00g014640.m01.CDS01 [Fusarium sp. VM40]